MAGSSPSRALQATLQAAKERIEQETVELREHFAAAPQPPAEEVPGPSAALQHALDEAKGRLGQEAEQLREQFSSQQHPTAQETGLGVGVASGHVPPLVAPSAELQRTLREAKERLETETEELRERLGVDRP